MDDLSAGIKLTLCARSCCPTIQKLGPDLYKVTDDFGGSVELNTENLLALQSLITKEISKV